MASNVCRFAILCAFSARYSAESQREEHPLCRALHKSEQQQPTHFPAAHVCLGDGADAICTPRTTETRDDSDGKEEPGAETWWVYRGRRKHASIPAEGISDYAWVDCTDYFACSSLVQGPKTVVGDSSRLRYKKPSEDIATIEQFPREATPREANGLPRTPALSQMVRAMQGDDTHGSAGVEIIPNRVERKENTRFNEDNARTSFVYAPNTTCDEVWLSWPAMQERAIARGTVVVFDVTSSVGNLFLIFGTLVKFVRLFDLGLILKWTSFPGFREAVNPGAVNWDLDDGPIMQQMGDTERGTNATGLHALEFRNFAMVLSDAQLGSLALTLSINETNAQALANHFREQFPKRMNLFMSRVMKKPLDRNEALGIQPCMWNMLFSRSPSIIASLEEHRPWGMVGDASGPRHQIPDYIAWHIRTSVGETSKSYNPSVHKYVIQEPSSEVCPTYLVATESALQRTEKCHRPLSVHGDAVGYVSSNSISMAMDCKVEAAKHDIAMVHVDMGLNSSDAHTWHSHHPLQTALGAFLDFFFLLDATIIVRTGSSFSGTVVKIKGLRCTGKVYGSLPKRAIFTCMPRDC